MLNGLFYLLTSLTILFLPVILYFTVVKIDYVDKTGREYNASFFIAVPLAVINMILCTILSFQSWNVEVAYVDAAGAFQIEIVQMEYLCYIFYVFFLINVLFIVWNSFDLLIASSYEPKGRWQR